MEDNKFRLSILSIFDNTLKLTWLASLLIITNFAIIDEIGILKILCFIISLILNLIRFSSALFVYLKSLSTRNGNMYLS